MAGPIELRHDAYVATSSAAPVIALVASAGGLAAVSRVLDDLPLGFPFSVLVLVHSSPDHASVLPELLATRTRLAVRAACDGDRLDAGSVLVAPPAFHTLVTPDRRVSLVRSGSFPPSRPSADLLFTTMATSLGPDAIGVVLSGGGTDGATGATAIHKHGGIIMATNEATSQAFSMPDATIRRDNIQPLVVPLDAVGSRLVNLGTTGRL